MTVSMSVAQDGLVSHQATVAQSQRELYQQTKTAIDRFAHADDEDEQHLQLKASIIAKGPEVFPILQDIFRGTENDEYRAAVLGLMLKLRVAEETKLEFLAAEFNQEGTRVSGGIWVFLAMNYLMENHSNVVADFAVKELRFADERIVKPQALAILEKYGDISVISTLEEFIATKRTSHSSRRESLVKVAEIAIERIKARNALTQGEKKQPVVDAFKPISKSEPMPLDKGSSERPDDRSTNHLPDWQIGRWLAGVMGLILGFAIVLVWIRRR